MLYWTHSIYKRQHCRKIVLAPILFNEFFQRIILFIHNKFIVRTILFIWGLYKNRMLAIAQENSPCRVIQETQQLSNTYKKVSTLLRVFHRTHSFNPEK